MTARMPCPVPLYATYSMSSPPACFLKRSAENWAMPSTEPYAYCPGLAFTRLINLFKDPARRERNDQSDRPFRILALSSHRKRGQARCQHRGDRQAKAQYITSFH